MALTRCAWCGSMDTQAGLDLVQCLACGNHTSFDGERAVATSLANEGVTVTDLPDPEPAFVLEVVPEPDTPPGPAPAVSEQVTVEQAVEEAEGVG